MTEELLKDDALVATSQRKASNGLFMMSYRGIIRQRVINYYLAHNYDDRLIEGRYINPGGIIDYTVKAVLTLSVTKAM